LKKASGTAKRLVKQKRPNMIAKKKLLSKNYFYFKLISIKQLLT